jgi:hypothetical protein
MEAYKALPSDLYVVPADTFDIADSPFTATGRALAMLLSLFSKTSKTDSDLAELLSQ